MYIPLAFQRSAAKAYGKIKDKMGTLSKPKKRAKSVVERRFGEVIGSNGDGGCTSPAPADEPAASPLLRRSSNITPADAALMTVTLIVPLLQLSSRSHRPPAQ